jgi:hypothetical protein
MATNTLLKPFRAELRIAKKATSEVEVEAEETKTKLLILKVIRTTKAQWLMTFRPQWH